MDCLTSFIQSKLFNLDKGGITPTGTKNITENGIYDIANYEFANVDIEKIPYDTLLAIQPTDLYCIVNTFIGSNLTNYTIEIKFALPNSSISGNGFIFGNYGTNYGYGSLYYKTNSNLCYFCEENNEYTIKESLTREQPHILVSKFTSTKIENTLNDEKLPDIERTANLTNQNFYLFNRRFRISIWRFTNILLYENF